MLEAIKGIAVLAASIGVLGLMHHDLRHLAHEAIKHLGMQPDTHYPLKLLHYVDVLENTNLRSLVLVAVGYAAVRLIESYGLWKDRVWGEWLGALSGGIYIPFEIQHFISKPSAIGAVIFVVNVGIVGFLGFRLYHRRRAALHLLP